MNYSKYHYLNCIEEEEDEIMKNIYKVASQDLLPIDHVNYLENVLHKIFNIEPPVIYDIGSAVLHWERHARRIWPHSKIYCFDAFDKLEPLYIKNNIHYNICCLSNKDNCDVKFYQNEMLFGGNSYLKEKTIHFPEDNHVMKKTITLDTLVKQQNIPYPELIKMDTQGSELDIIKGASEVLKHCRYLILELQDIEYNRGAPLAPFVIEYLQKMGYMLFKEKFSVNVADADYMFVNTYRSNDILDCL